jgi:Zn-dependent protease with chaperone function
MKRRLALILSGFLFRAAFSQVTLENFSPLVSSGTIPEDLISFYLQSSENSQSKSSSDFIQHNTVEFGNLFASGKIIFNDPLSRYARKILDTILWRQPQVRQKIRIYTLKSAVTNAYTTNDGKIFITTGLYARLQNEAELALILSHEIIHYLNNHAYESYVFNRSVDRKKRTVNNREERFEDVLLTKFRHSRSNEFEADKQGLLLFLRSEYSLAVIDSVFNMLDYSELPLSNQPFDRGFFESPYFHIRDEAWLPREKVLPVEVDADFKEARSTHPNSKSRKAQIQSILDKSDDIGAVKKLYLYPEEEFDLVRDLSQFDLCNVYYLDHNYEDAIYQAWLLLRRFPGNLYLRKTIARCLNGLLIENSYRLGLYDHNQKRGYISQLAHLIRYSDREELEAMALIFTWNTFKDHRDDNDLKTLLNKFFGYIDEKEPTFFYRKNIADIKLGELSSMLKDTAGTKNEERELKEKRDEIMRRTCFADLLGDAEFATALQQAQLSKAPFDIPTTRLESNKMLVIPLVYVVDSVSGKKSYSNPQKIIGDYSSQVRELGREKNLQFTFMSTYDLKPGDVDRYNEYALLSDWVSVNENKEVQSFVDFEHMEKLGEKYRSRYLCLTGVYLYRNTPGFKFRRWLFFTLLVPPGAGVIPGTAQLFTANYSAYYSTVIYDMETGKVVSRTSDSNFNNPRPQTRKKNFWHTLKPWFSEKILGKETTE